MSVRFVIGRAGTGKTRHCFDGIVNALRADPLGQPIHWVLPKQATFMAERELTCASGLDGFCRARVVSFETLGAEVLADCGGAAVPQVTAQGRQMVLGHLLRRNQDRLKFFKSVAKQASLASELDATFAEFERCGKSAADLADLLRDLASTAGEDDAHATSLAAKFHDLHLLYDAYSNYLGQDRLDPHRRLAEVLACIENCKLIQRADVYVDSFLEFSEFERRMLSSIGKVCRQMQITLLLDPASAVIADPHHQPDELSLFHRTEQTYKQLWFTFSENGVGIEAPILLTKPRRFNNPSLTHAERCLFARRPSPAESSDGIAMIEAPDRRAEVDAAARHIRELLRRGLRLREIGVLVRDLSAYHELIDASFREHAIRYFVDRRRAAAYHPLPQIIRAALLIAQHRWPHDAMITLLKSGLCGLVLREADELENYVLLHRIKGDTWASPQPWPFRRNLTRRRGESDDDLLPGERIELDRINEIRRRLIDPLMPFIVALAAAPRAPIRDYVAQLYSLLERLNVRKILSQWIQEAQSRNDLVQLAEHAQVWAQCAELFDQMVELMGDEVVDLPGFLAIVDSGLEQLDLALTPPTVDQVLVGAVDRTRTPPLKAAIVLGLVEAEFPRVPRDGTMLSDSERRTLKERRINVDPDGERQLLDENLFGYIAFTRASDDLLLTRPAADDQGRPLLASPFWRRARETFPNAQVQRISRESRNIDLIGTPRQLVTSLMHWVRQSSPSPCTQGEGRGEGSFIPTTEMHPLPNSLPAYRERENWPALYHWLATHECCNDAIDVMRYRAWRALSYRNDAALDDATANALFASPLRASVSRIESFAACPFKHFACYGLGLREREEQDVTALDLGNVYHSILEKLVRQIADSSRDFADISDSAIKACAAEVGESLRGELMLSSARNRYLLSRIEKTVNQVVASQDAAARRGKFKPKWAELEFGRDGSKLPALTMRTPGGNEVHLHGKIDRVDVLEEQAAFAVIDYKLRGSSLSLDEVYHGLALQLLSYLLVLQANGQQLEGKKLTPAAAFYIKLLRQLDDAKHPADAPLPGEPEFDLKTRPRGLLDVRFLREIDQEMPGGKSQVVQVQLKRDGTLGYRNRSDAAEPGEFAALLRHVQKKIAALADRIIAAEISVRPYRLNETTPCPRCEFRSVCRFEVPVNSYLPLAVLGREQVLDQLSQA